MVPFQRSKYTKINIIEKGNPDVTIGAYVKVLSVLGLENDIMEVANDDKYRMSGFQIRIHFITFIAFKNYYYPLPDNNEKIPLLLYDYFSFVYILQFREKKCPE